MNFMNISLLFSGHGFGINTNIFDTNVINLSVVIAVVVSFGGDALRDLLSTRKQKIVDNIASADRRVKEAELKIQEAHELLAQSEQKAAEIRQNGTQRAAKEKKACIAQGENEAQRLHAQKQESVRFAKQRTMKQIASQMVTLSVDKASTQFKQFHKSLEFHPFFMKHTINTMSSLTDTKSKRRQPRSKTIYRGKGTYSFE